MPNPHPNFTRPFAHIPGVAYPSQEKAVAEQAHISRDKKDSDPKPARIDNELWWYVVRKGATEGRRIFGIFPLQEWAEQWREGMEPREDYEVKQVMDVK